MPLKNQYNTLRCVYPYGPDVSLRCPLPSGSVERGHYITRSRPFYRRPNRFYCSISLLGCHICKYQVHPLPPSFEIIRESGDLRNIVWDRYVAHTRPSEHLQVTCRREIRAGNARPPDLQLDPEQRMQYFWCVGAFGDVHRKRPGALASDFAVIDGRYPKVPQARF